MVHNLIASYVVFVLVVGLQGYAMRHAHALLLERLRPARRWAFFID